MNLQSDTNTRSIIKNLEFLVKRFGHDLLGIMFISTAVISLLNKLNITEGKFLNQWVRFIDIWFGWGSYLLIAILAVLGIFILLRRFEKFPRMDLKRVIFIELAFLSICALLSAIGGFSVETASEGQFGGIVGWGLARLFRNVIGRIPTLIILILVSIIFLFKAIDQRNHTIEFLDNYFERVFTGGKRYQQAAKDIYETNSVGMRQGSKEKSQKNELGLETYVGEKALPPVSLLLDKSNTLSDEPYIHSKAIQIEKTLEEFGIPARVAGYRVGPTIIQYAIEPGFVEKINEEGNISKKKVRVSQIVRLRKDIALALSVDRLRIEAPIPGHAFVGIEIPNQNSSLVRIKSILESEEFKRQHSSLSLALGLDVSGNPVVADLAKMPHLLIAGTTGSGKSVCITSIITCIAMNNHPNDLHLSILDPKMVELVRFNGLPHLMGKVETQLDRMLAVLPGQLKKWRTGIKNLRKSMPAILESYNQKMRQQGGESLPKIVIVIDELADLMLNETEKTEAYLVRLAQMARATGIHLVVATQRPSTDIITGLIKANFPARISFMMASSVDSGSSWILMALRH